MMPKIARIELPDGKIAKFEVPDDFTPEQVEAAANAELERISPGKYRKPVYGGEYKDEPAASAEPVDDRPTSFWEGAAKGAAVPFYNIARAAEGLSDRLGIGENMRAFGEFVNPGATPGPGGVSAEQDRFNANLEGGDYRPSATGQFAGEFAATLPVLALPGGAAVQGAAAGALLTDARDLKGAAGDAAMGAVGGVAGDRLMRGAAAVVSPHLQPAVRRLIDEGVPLTPGQIVGQGGVVGRSAKRVEDSLMNFPIIGNAVRSSRRRGDEALNRAATNRALRPIGEALPPDQPLGHEAVAYAGNRLSGAYADVLPRLNGRIDAGFARRVTTIRARASLPPQYDEMLDQAQQELANAFTRAGPNGVYSGRTLRDTSERLRDLASAWRVNDDPYVRRVGEAAEQMRQQLHALARRQNPRHAQRLRDVDRGYASLVRLERAAAGTSDGVFTAGQYKTATRQSDQSVRKRQSARGEALDQDLSSAGAQVLPSTVGEGGSTAVNSLGILGALGTGALGGAEGAMATVAGLGAGSLLYTPLGQRVAQSALAGRQGPFPSALAEYIRRSAGAGGLIGATAVPHALSQTQP